MRRRESILTKTNNYCAALHLWKHLSVPFWTMNASHLTGPDSLAENSNDVLPSAIAVNEEENLNSPVAASNGNVSKERATSVLPVLDNVPYSAGVNVNVAFE